MNHTLLSAACAAAMISMPAMAEVSISLGSSAPTYGTTLNFDEVGGPTGDFISTDAWSGIGIGSLGAGDGNTFVGNLNSTPGFGWLPDNNVMVGNFGVFMEFSTDLTSFSAQVWDNGGPADFVSGGMLAVAQKDGVDVATYFWETPVFGTGGDNWFDITTTDGSSFDRVVFLGFAFVSPVTIIDNVSFNTVPVPGTAAVMGCGLMLAGRRRRA
ncbi:MAG: hypothetical protein CMJ25_17060 [Phycisphaerae bacterium]|nr:hypothetical protein [Phycisphaerae bacterium]